METTRLLEARASHGDADAMFRLGYRLAFGRKRVRGSWRRAAAWWRRAATAGHARATFYLGTCFDRGLGVRRDVPRAVALFRAAANAGHEVARYNLGFSLLRGDCVRKDTKA